jgi:hypothetical protein
VTITDSLEAAISTAVVTTRGLPGYTFERAAGELWRCRFDAWFDSAPGHKLDQVRLKLAAAQRRQASLTTTQFSVRVVLPGR